MRALVIEDHAATADAVSRVLTREGFTAVEASDGAGGAREARNGDYDLIVLDLRLPDLDGVELCRELRADGLWVPVLIVSGRGGTTDVVRGLEAGADDYLAKPFAVDELRARVRALVRRNRLGGDGVRPAAPAGFELDPPSRSLISGPHRLELSPREFRLLEVLAGNEGRVCSRAQLLRQVWERADGQGKLVDVYVGYLRRKLAQVQAPLSIETVRGVGYRLVAPAGPS